MKGAYEFDDVIRFENLENDVRRVAEKVGMPKDLGALVHTRESRPLKKFFPFFDLYQPHHIALVQKSDAWLFDKFGYDADFPTKNEVAAI